MNVTELARTGWLNHPHQEIRPRRRTVQKEQPRRLHILEKWNPVQQCLVVSGSTVHVRPHMVRETKRCAQNFEALQMCGQFWTSPHVRMLVHDPRQPLQNLTPRRLNPSLVPHVCFPLVDADPGPRQQGILE